MSQLYGPLQDHKSGHVIVLHVIVLLTNDCDYTIVTFIFILRVLFNVSEVLVKIVQMQCYEFEFETKMKM